MDSTELRLILLGAGIILVIGIYAWEKGKRHRRATRERLATAVPRTARSRRRGAVWQRLRRDAEDFRAEAGEAARREPRLAGDGAELGDPADRVEPRLAEEPAPSALRDVDRSVDDDRPKVDLDRSAPSLPAVLVVNIAARVGQRFSGDAVMSAARDVGLVPGRMEIMHRFDEDSGEVLLSMASMVKPGTFPFQSMSDFSTPGLALFAQLPAPRPPLEIYETLIETGERLAALLNGRLQDERRRPLTGDARDRMRERLAGAGAA